jgi:hypothetical protein
MIAFWFANRGRTKGQNKPLMVRVDNRHTNFDRSSTKDQTLRSAGFLGLGALAIGIFAASTVSVVVAFIFSALTSSLGN